MSGGEQERIFERLVADLRNLRNLERQAVEMLIELAENSKTTEEQFSRACEHHELVRSAYCTVVEQLKATYFS